MHHCASPREVADPCRSMQCSDDGINNRYKAATYFDDGTTKRIHVYLSKKARIGLWIEHDFWSKPSDISSVTPRRAWHFGLFKNEAYAKVGEVTVNENICLQRTLVNVFRELRDIVTYASDIFVDYTRIQTV